MNTPYEIEVVLKFNNGHGHLAISSYDAQQFVHKHFPGAEVQNCSFYISESFASVNFRVYLKQAPMVDTKEEIPF